MATAAHPRPRTRRFADLPPLAGRDLDARDIAFIRGIAHNTPAAAAIGYDDALSAGLLAYWKAGMRYDPAGQASWRTYAVLAVRRGIQEEARSRDHLSRWHRDEVKAGRLPDMPAAVSLDQAPEDRGERFDRGAARQADLVDLIPASARDEDLRITVDAALEAVHRVHPRAAAVLRLTYEQGMRDEDIGVLLGVGHSQVSRLRTLGRGLIRELLPLELLDAA